MFLYGTDIFKPWSSLTLQIVYTCSPLCKKCEWGKNDILLFLFKVKFVRSFIVAAFFKSYGDLLYTLIWPPPLFKNDCLRISNNLSVFIKKNKKIKTYYILHLPEMSKGLIWCKDESHHLPSSVLSSGQVECFSVSSPNPF